MSRVLTEELRTAGAGWPATVARAGAYPARGPLDWLDDPRSDRGLHFLVGREWRRFGYPELARQVHAAAARLVAWGLRRDDVVALVLPNGPEFPTAFTAVLLAGGTPCPLAVPESFRSGAYGEHLAAVLRVARPAFVLTTAELLPTVAAAVAEGGLTIPVRELALDGDGAAGSPAPSRPRARLALLQFTSGSTGAPRGVEVSWDNLEANLAMMRSWTADAGAGGVATWLPFFHDMGLIGTLLGPMAFQYDLRVLRPDQFLRSPMQWLECFHDGRSAASVCPCFGFAYLARRVRPEQVAGLDLSGWRVAIVGADRIQPGVLADVNRLLAPTGFQPGTVAPAYGLAEATLLVTGARVGRPPYAVRIDWSTLRFGSPVPVLERALAHQVPGGSGGDESRGWVVNCGRPHPGTDVSIVDENGVRVPDGHLGEIVVTGASVATGYRTVAPAGAPGQAGQQAFQDGRLRTGDAGFTIDGELYVIGRIAHSVKVRGRNLYVEDVEAAVATACPLPAHAYVVLGGVGEDGPVLAAVAETGQPDQLVALCEQLWQLGGEEVDAVVYRVPRGAIRRTSSGKPRRAWLWWRLVAGDLGAEAVHRIPATKAQR
ncbi:MAG TPA: AMP-binding protein [Micromonosporaceae bacterium]|nr:AMP-binding protein [Micromonosporaceae bacterium]